MSRIATSINRKTQLTADLTTEATFQPAEWGPVSLPLGRNLLLNPGFELGLGTSVDGGWKIERQENGLVASVSSEAARSGRRGLLVQQVDPVVFPEAAFTAADYGAFVKAANGGKGGGQVTLRQRVPVTGGRQYAYRFYRRTEGMKPEVKTPGKNRGYSTVSAWIQWEGGRRGQTWVANLQGDTDGWEETCNAECGNWGVPRPYTAPAAATAAMVTFYFTALAPDIAPIIRLDDVEFVELPRESK